MRPREPKRLKALKAWLAIASAEDTSAIREMIAKLEYPEERSGTAREEAPATVHTSPAASVGAQPAAPLPADDPLAGLPAAVHWRQARQVLRILGHEVHQVDGVLFLDGKRCDDPRLRP